MPRDANGDFTLVAGNPVASGTTITTAWANNTLDDIKAALTDSLSRSGKGGMQAVLELLAGSAATPGLAFEADPTTGLYLPATGQLGFAVSTQLKLLLDSLGTRLNGTDYLSAWDDKNKVINGAMEIAQRGTSFAAAASGTFPVDRFSYQFAATTAVVMASQQADAPSSNEFRTSLRIAVTTADAAIAAGDVALVEQRIEGYNARDLIGRTFTLGFWVRSSKTGTHCVAFRNSSGDRSYVATYTVNAANTWEYKYITVPNGLITAGTWDWTNGSGLLVSWILAAGSTFQTGSPLSWQPTNVVATAGQVNCLDTIGNIFAITGVQLESGTAPTPFARGNFQRELAACQRYYEIGSFGFNGAYQAAGSGCVFTQPYKVTKRVTPTSLVASGTSVGNLTAPGLTALDADAFTFGGTATATGVVVYTGQFAASAEL